MFREWVRWAKSRQDTKLLFFNLRNEILYYRKSNGVGGKILSPTNLPPHIAEFAHYLNSAAKSNLLDKALRDFAELVSQESRAGNPLIRPRVFGGIKGYGTLVPSAPKYELAKLGLSTLNCVDAIAQIEETIADLNTTHPDARVFPPKAKQEIAAIVQRKFAPAPRASHPRASGATASMHSPTFIPSGTPSRDLMWVTCLDTLDASCAPPSDLTEAFLSSAHITQVRKELGLYNDKNRDRERDLTGGKNASLSRVKYRIFLKIRAEFAERVDLKEVRQPNMLSSGFDYLFVSRRPADPTTGTDDMPGRTVRLIDKNCDHDGLGLEKCPRCGGEGLPEAVVPRDHLFTKGNAALVSAHVAFASDLARYQLPDPATIRRKNPLKFAARPHARP